AGPAAVDAALLSVADLVDAHSGPVAAPNCSAADSVDAAVHADSPALAGCVPQPGRETPPGQHPAFAVQSAAKDCLQRNSVPQLRLTAATDPAVDFAAPAGLAVPAAHVTSAGTAAPAPGSAVPARAAGAPAHGAAAPHSSAPCVWPDRAGPGSVLPADAPAPPVCWLPRSCVQSRRCVVFHSGSPSVPFPSQTARADLHAPAARRRPHRRWPAGC